MSDTDTSGSYRMCGQCDWDGTTTEPTCPGCGAASFIAPDGGTTTSDGDRPDPIGPNDEYEWCNECEDHHAWECYFCGEPTGRDARKPCCHCGQSA